MLRTEFRPLTVRDYRQLPEGPPYYQLIEGELYMAPSPERYHQDILGNLYLILRSYLEKRPLGSVHLAPSDVCLSDINVFQPDLYYVRSEEHTSELQSLTNLVCRLLLEKKKKKKK